MVRVEVVYCPVPGPSEHVDLTALTLAEGATVQDALQHSGVLQRHGLDIAAVDVGLWFKACTLQQLLRDQDQVQVYRPLKVDPKEARRQRYRKRGPSDKSGKLAAAAAVSGTPPR